MKPSLLGIWLPYEIARLDWPEGLTVVRVELQGEDGQVYLLQCPDHRRAMQTIQEGMRKE